MSNNAENSDSEDPFTAGLRYLVQKFKAQRDNSPESVERVQKYEDLRAQVAQLNETVRTLERIVQESQAPSTPIAQGKKAVCPGAPRQPKRRTRLCSATRKRLAIFANLAWHNIEAEACKRDLDEIRLVAGHDGNVETMRTAALQGTDVFPHPTDVHAGLPAADAQPRDLADAEPRNDFDNIAEKVHLNLMSEKCNEKIAELDLKISEEAARVEALMDVANAEHSEDAEPRDSAAAQARDSADAQLSENAQSPVQPVQNVKGKRTRAGFGGLIVLSSDEESDSADAQPNDSADAEPRDSTNAEPGDVTNPVQPSKPFTGRVDALPTIFESSSDSEWEEDLLGELDEMKENVFSGVAPRSPNIDIPFQIVRVPHSERGVYVATYRKSRCPKCPNCGAQATWNGKVRSGFYECRKCSLRQYRFRPPSGVGRGSTEDIRNGWVKS